MTLKVYYAGPLFTAAERSWNEWFVDALRDEGFDVVSPQEEALKHISPSGNDFAGIFETCLRGIRSADVIVAVFDGADVDSGAAFECGYAYAIRKPIVGIRTDLRSGGEENGVNAMLSECCEKLVYVPAFNRCDEFVGPVISALSAIRDTHTRDEVAREAHLADER
jgi:nucleoside 2-deoxyribosyltransferase